jgi:hypothetical protein
MRVSSEESLLLLPLALEGHAPDALGVINKAQLLVQTNNLRSDINRGSRRTCDVNPGKNDQVLVQTDNLVAGVTSRGGSETTYDLNAERRLSGMVTLEQLGKVRHCRLVD